MKDFDGILTEIDGLKAESKRLEAEKKECKQTIAKDIVENLINIYLPFIDKVRSSEDSFGRIGENFSIFEEFEGMPMSFNTSHGFFFIYGGRSTYYPHNIEVLIKDIANITSRNDDDFDCLARTFGTATVAQKFVERCIDAYAKRLDSIASHYQDSNSKLADSVEKLKTMIAENSKVVKEKEDGSIEITLGGKVYVGHLKEKED